MVLRKIRDEAEALSALRAVAASGQPRAVWARAHGLDARSLNGWRVALEQRDRTRRRAEVLDLRVVELVARKWEPEPEPPARYRILCGELAVEIDDSFEAETLRRILAVVQTC